MIEARYHTVAVNGYEKGVLQNPDPHRVRIGNTVYVTTAGTNRNAPPVRIIL